MTQEHSAAEVAAEIVGLPFAAQRAALSARFDRGPAFVLDVARRLPDAEALAELLPTLLRRGGLDGPEGAAVLERLLIDLPDTECRRVLLPLRPEEAEVDLGPVVAAVLAALRLLPIERLALVCMLERWLARADPEARAAFQDEAEERARWLVGEDRVEDLADEDLLRIPGPRLDGLADLARARGRARAWKARMDAFARRVIAVLKAAPKTLSQANAEDLLSRRVYTDPGHFLFELLQNAEDAGAVNWSVTIRRDELRVWHDGRPFDAKDVVGVLSIGQTTKRKDQIGFFGVGFKSVYEVSDRPCIDSGHFRFEIADVSRPRPIATRPEDAPAGGTLLVLPYRRGLRLSPEELFEKALAVPDLTLLTLPSLRRLSVAFEDRRRSIREEEDAGPGRRVLIHEEEGRRRAFLIAEETARFPGPREAGRAAESPVLVAIALDADGEPEPLDPGEATVFSYLPTGERPGLRFLIHARFDVPVDRERLDLDAPWNRWALERAGVVLARAARRLVDEAGGDPPRKEALTSLLTVLPAPDELAHPAWAAILERFRREVAELPLLVGLDGQLRSPMRAAVLDRHLADPRAIELFREAELLEDRRALAPLPPRSARVAIALGARPFAIENLAELITRSAGQASQGWLSEAALFSLLGRALPELDELRAVPFIPDQDGDPRSPAELRRAAPALRALYGSSRRFLRPDLDGRDDPDLERLWAGLALPTLDQAALIADLLEPIARAEILARADDADVLEQLRGADEDRLFELGREPLILIGDERRPLRPVDPLSGGGLWLAPEGPFGAFLSRALPDSPEPRPALVPEPLAARFPKVLAAMGARILDLEAALDLMEAGRLVAPPSHRLALHDALDALADRLGQATLRRLAAAPLFPDRRGQTRPLVGPEAALIPDDPGLVALFPDLPWLDEALAARPSVANYRIPRVDAERIAAALLGREDLFDPTDEASLSAAYRALTERADALPPRLRPALAAAPLWRDQAGARYPLDQLRRRPKAPELAELYEAWGAFPLIEDRGEAPAAGLVAALELEGRLRLIDHAVLIADLAAGPLDPLGPLRPRLLSAIDGVIAALPKAELRGLRRCPLYRDPTGSLGFLGDWEDEEPGRRRALEPLRGFLSAGARPLLHPEDEADFAPLIRALDLRPARAWDLLPALEGDPAFARDEARAQARGLLVALRAELDEQAPPEAARRRLSALPLWPAGPGALKPAREVALAAELRRVLGAAGLDEDPRGALAGAAILDAEAEQEARGLAGLVAFRDPIALIIERIRGLARPGLVLAEQPPFLREPEALASILEVLAEDLGREPARLFALPLAVDARGRLVARELMRAEPDDLAILGEDRLVERLALPRWAEALERRGLDLLPRLNPRRVLEAAARGSRDAARVDEHPRWRDAGERERWYAWLLARSAVIAADPQALGSLKKIAAIATRGGALRAPRDLIFDRGLPELGEDWTPADEVPDALCAWFRQVDRLDERRRDRLVDLLARAHEDAIAARDIPRSAALLRALSGALEMSGSEPEAREQAARRAKLPRRIRVAAAEDEGFVRPRKLLCPSAQEAAWIEDFCDEPPPRAHRAYADPAARSLLLALGGRARLELEDLEALLRGQRPLRQGLEPALAFARYLARALIDELRLRPLLCERPWIPDRQGAIKCPGDLSWPDPEIEAVLGASPELFPHPAWIDSVPEEVRRRLPLRSIAEAPLEKVIGALMSDEPAPEETLDWLEEGLAAKRLKAEEVALALSGARVFVDEQGRRRAPRELLRCSDEGLFGARRAPWPGAGKRPRLSDALRLPQVITALVIQSALEEIEAERAAGQTRALARDPGLAEGLPRCLARLDALGARPGPRTPIVAVAEDGRLCLVPIGHERLAFPEPAALAEAAQSLGLPFLIPVLPEDEAERAERALKACGVGDLSRFWQPETLPAELPGDLSAEESALIGLWQRRLEALWSLLPRVRAGLEPRLAEGWTDDPEPPRSLALVEELELSGALLGERVVLPVPAAYDAPRGRLILRLDEARWGGEAARVLADALIRPGPADLELLDVLAELLALDEAESMSEVLDRRGFTRQAPAPKPREEAPEARKSEREGGLLGRVRRFFGGARPEDEGPSEPTPPRPRPVMPPSPSPRRRSEPPGPARSPEPEPDRRSFFSRWFGGEDEEAPARGDGDQRRWFRPRSMIPAQLEAIARDVSREVPRYGFAHAPARLPQPYLYAHNLIAGAFDQRRQRWLPIQPREEWTAPVGEGRSTVSLRGRAPKGELRLPLPIYARLEDAQGKGVRVLSREPGSCRLLMEEEGMLSCSLALDAAPDFENPAAATAEGTGDLLRPTAPDRELPDEVLDVIEDLKRSADPWLVRALTIRDFVRERYRYDPSALEDPSVGRWLERASRGRSNRHLAALHAGGDSEVLGRGVCYELNVLVCELLRRAGIPAGIATGWTFDRGSVTAPDHLWALALLPSSVGPRWLPLDASSTRDGRPLHGARRPAPPWRPQERGRRRPMPSEPEWSREQEPRAPAEHTPISELARVLAFLEKKRGGGRGQRERARRLLDDPERLRRLLEEG